MTSDVSPGPIHALNSNYTRRGKDGTPHYSLFSRPADLRIFKPPGPGTYSPEHAGPQSHYHAPVYSFGSRSRYRVTDDNPGSNLLYDDLEIYVIHYE